MPGCRRPPATGRAQTVAASVTLLAPMFSAAKMSRKAIERTPKGTKDKPIRDRRDEKATPCLFLLCWKFLIYFDGWIPPCFYQPGPDPVPAGDISRPMKDANEAGRSLEGGRGRIIIIFTESLEKTVEEQMHHSRSRPRLQGRSVSRKPLWWHGTLLWLGDEP